MNNLVGFCEAIDRVQLNANDTLDHVYIRLANEKSDFAIWKLQITLQIEMKNVDESNKRVILWKGGYPHAVIKTPPCLFRKGEASHDKEGIEAFTKKDFTRTFQVIH